MTREQEIELIEAFSRAWTGEDEPPALEQLRIAWAQVTDEEREVFRREVLIRHQGERVG